jgi:hypothetical protein
VNNQPTGGTDPSGKDIYYLIDPDISPRPFIAAHGAVLIGPIPDGKGGSYFQYLSVTNKGSILQSIAEFGLHGGTSVNVTSIKFKSFEDFLEQSKTESNLPEGIKKGELKRFQFIVKYDTPSDKNLDAVNAVKEHFAIPYVYTGFTNCSDAFIFALKATVNEKDFAMKYGNVGNLWNFVFHPGLRGRILLENATKVYGRSTFNDDWKSQQGIHLPILKGMLNQFLLAFDKWDRNFTPRQRKGLGPPPSLGGIPSDPRAIFGRPSILDIPPDPRATLGRPFLGATLGPPPVDPPPMDPCFPSVDSCPLSVDPYPSSVDP